MWSRSEQSDLRRMTYSDLQLCLSHLLNTDCQSVSSVTLAQLHTSARLNGMEPNLWKYILCDLDSETKVSLPAAE